MMEWIKCTERLPSISTTVLGYTTYIVFAEFDEDGWVEIPYFWEIHPSHWMPLPEAPKGEE